MTNKILLLHGAWVDGSSWSRVIPLLEGDGFQVMAAQLPLTSLTDDIAAAKRALAYLGGPAMLVGHSYAGAVISNVDDSGAAGLVYVAAFVPEDGQTVGALNDSLPKMPAAQFLRPGDGCLWMAREGFADSFAPDVDEATARLLAATQKPIGFACFGEPTRQPGWTRLPTAYVVSELDRVISPHAQHAFARRIGARVTTAGAGHLSPASQPEVVVRAIATLAREVGG